MDIKNLNVDELSKLLSDIFRTTFEIYYDRYGDFPLEIHLEQDGESIYCSNRDYEGINIMLTDIINADIDELVLERKYKEAKQKERFENLQKSVLESSAEEKKFLYKQLKKEFGE